MINIQIEISKEILGQKISTANYIKKISYITLIIDMMLFFCVEIFNIINLSNFEHKKFIPIIFRVIFIYHSNNFTFLAYYSHKPFAYINFRYQRKRSEADGIGSCSVRNLDLLI